MKRHRNAMDKEKENEEELFATRGEDGSVKFTCPICEVSFESQKNVIQHTMTKHGMRYSRGTGGTLKIAV